jgi:hypothetical protein
MPFLASRVDFTARVPGNGFVAVFALALVEAIRLLIEIAEQAERGKVYVSAFLGAG